MSKTSGIQKVSTELQKVSSYFPSILHSKFRIPDVRFKNLLFPHQGLLLLLVALLPLVIESAPTIQSLVPALAFTPVVCPIALARSIIKKVALSLFQHFPFLFAHPHFWCLTCVCYIAIYSQVCHMIWNRSVENAGGKGNWQHYKRGSPGKEHHAQWCFTFKIILTAPSNLVHSLYDAFSVVVECWVAFWSDFQSGSKVLKHRKNCKCCPVSLLVVRSQ